MRAGHRCVRALGLPHRAPVGSAAAEIWALVDRELVDRALWLPMIDEGGVDSVSSRIRNYQFHPYGGVIVDQLWLR